MTSASPEQISIVSDNRGWQHQSPPRCSVGPLACGTAAMTCENVVARPGTLSRTTLVTSRLLDFTSKKELTAQTGHEPGTWPLVILKELTDNGLDACEEAGIAPEITIAVDESGITVVDNGPGIPAKTIEGVLDYAVRVSSREAYVSPTRGAKGTPSRPSLRCRSCSTARRGNVQIDTGGLRHNISFRVDRIRQEPVVDLAREPSEVRIGTVVKVVWPHSACSILTGAKERFLQIASDYAWLNPHLTLTVAWFGERAVSAATDPAWIKWKPSDPTSAHWYTTAHLERLIAGYISHDDRPGQSRTVRELVAEFRGLTGTAKQKLVLERTGFPARLCPSWSRDAPSTKPWWRPCSRPCRPNPSRSNRTCSASSAENTWRYASQKPAAKWRASIIAGSRRSKTASPGSSRQPSAGALRHPPGRLVTGVNWSPGIVNPFRELGRFGMSLDTVLTRQRVDRDDPIDRVPAYRVPSGRIHRPREVGRGDAHEGGRDHRRRRGRRPKNGPSSARPRRDNTPPSLNRRDSHDPTPHRHPERGRMGRHGGGISEGERQRHAAGQCPSDDVCRPAADSRN